MHEYAASVTAKHIYGIVGIGEINGTASYAEPHIYDGIPGNYDWLLDEESDLVLEG